MTAMRSARLLQKLLVVTGALAAGATLSACTVVTVAGAAVSVVTTTAGLAVDATVGTVKLASSAVGAVLPSSSSGTAP